MPKNKNKVKKDIKNILTKSKTKKKKGKPQKPQTY